MEIESNKKKELRETAYKKRVGFLRPFAHGTEIYATKRDGYVGRVFLFCPLSVKCSTVALHNVRMRP